MLLVPPTPPLRWLLYWPLALTFKQSIFCPHSASMRFMDLTIRKIIIACRAAINHFCNRLSVCNARYEVNLEIQLRLMLVFKWLFIKKIKIYVSYQVDVSCPRHSLFWRTVVLFWNSSYISLKDHFYYVFLIQIFTDISSWRCLGYNVYIASLHQRRNPKPLTIISDPGLEFIIQTQDFSLEIPA
jgi:hypothetical protein